MLLAQAMRDDVVLTALIGRLDAILISDDELTINVLYR